MKKVFIFFYLLICTSSLSEETKRNYCDLLLSQTENNFFEIEKKTARVIAAGGSEKIIYYYDIKYYEIINGEKFYRAMLRATLSEGKLIINHYVVDIGSKEITKYEYREVQNLNLPPISRQNKSLEMFKLLINEIEVNGNFIINEIEGSMAYTNFKIFQSSIRTILGLSPFATYMNDAKEKLETLSDEDKNIAYTSAIQDLPFYKVLKKIGFSKIKKVELEWVNSGDIGNYIVYPTITLTRP